MTDQHFANAIETINHWWAGGGVGSQFIEKVERNIFPELVSALAERQIILLQGTRRVGKTVLLYRLIKHLLDSGVPPRNIVYLSMDDPLLGVDNLLQNFIDYYQRQVLGAPIRESPSRIYLFLDEITKLENWALYLKRYYDQRYPFKLVISSSSMAFLQKRVKESLAGRIMSFTIAPFTFSEYMEVKGGMPAREIYRKLRKLWSTTLIDQDLEKAYHEFQGFEKELIPFREKLQLAVEAYLQEGGFPEYLQLESPRAKQNYFWENVIERVLYYDIPEVFGVEDRSLLQKVLLHGVFSSGDMLNVNELAAVLQAPRQTISKYLRYLEAALLVSSLEKYAKTAASRMRAYKKIYAIDPGMGVNLERTNARLLEATGRIGKLAEVLVLTQLQSYLPFHRIYYWNERQKEVDFVVELSGSLFPLEVKYRKKVSELPGLDEFSRKFKTQPGLIVSKDKLAYENNRLYVPMYLFLS